MSNETKTAIAEDSAVMLQYEMTAIVREEIGMTEHFASQIAEAIDHPSPARLSPAAIDGVVAEFKARLARKGWIPSRINMVGDQLHVILTESFGGGQ